MRRVSNVVTFTLFTGILALFVAACSGAVTSPTPTQGTATAIKYLGIEDTRLEVSEVPTTKLRLPYGDRFSVCVSWALSDEVWKKVQDRRSWPKLNTCQGPSSAAIGGTCEVTSLMAQAGQQCMFAGTIPNAQPYVRREVVEMKFVHAFVTMETNIYPGGEWGLEQAINFPLDSLAVAPVAEDKATPVETTWYRPER